MLSMGSARKFALLFLGLTFVAHAESVGASCLAGLEALQNLAQARPYLERKLARDDQLKNAPAEIPAEELAKVPGATLGQALILSEIPRSQRKQTKVMSDIDRALHDRLFVIQNYVLAAGEGYKLFMESSHGFDPTQERAVKKWLDARAEQVFNSLCRDCIKSESLATIESNLNSLIVDMEAFTIHRERFPELLARYEAVVVAQKKAQLLRDANQKPLLEIILSMPNVMKAKGPVDVAVAEAIPASDSTTPDERQRQQAEALRDFEMAVAMALRPYARNSEP